MILQTVTQTSFDTFSFVAKGQTFSENLRPLDDFQAEEGEIQRFSQNNDKGWWLGLGEGSNKHAHLTACREAICSRLQNQN